MSTPGVHQLPSINRMSSRARPERIAECHISNLRAQCCTIAVARIR
jgi:hypothetical protein